METAHSPARAGGSASFALVVAAGRCVASRTWPAPSVQGRGTSERGSGKCGVAHAQAGRQGLALHERGAASARTGCRSGSRWPAGRRASLPVVERVRAAGQPPPERPSSSSRPRWRHDGPPGRTADAGRRPRRNRNPNRPGNRSEPPAEERTNRLKNRTEPRQNEEPGRTEPPVRAPAQRTSPGRPPVSLLTFNAPASSERRLALRRTRVARRAASTSAASTPGPSPETRAARAGAGRGDAGEVQMPRREAARAPSASPPRAGPAAAWSTTRSTPAT